MNEDRPLVLIIEDDDKAADLIRLQLEADHCRTVRATSGETALAILAAERPDLITLDILLPGMDGWEFLNRLKDSADIPHVPVVIVSIVGDGGHGLSLGAAEVLQKPVLAKDIHEALANLGLVFEGAVGKPVRVLVVDDDPQAVEILAAHLAQNHYQVLRAYDGREALTLARTSPPDLIVLDLLMPGTSGFEVMEELKSTPKTAHIPVIVLTAKPLGADEREQLNRHVLKVMEKSTFNHGRFIGEVRRALRKA
jgi:CheY-like chemotaxis protein